MTATTHEMEPTASRPADAEVSSDAWSSSSKTRRRRFKELYDQHFRLVWSAVRAGGVQSAHCEDVVQEVWIQVHRLVERLRPDASARAWLVSIARRRVAHYHRTQRRRNRRESAYGEASTSREVSHGGRVEARSTLDRVLEGMNDEQRTAFVLVHGYGLTGEEVALAVGDNVNTVYSRLRLARRYLQRVAVATDLEERRVATRSLRHLEPPRAAQTRMRVLLVFKLGLPGLGVIAPGGAASLGTLGSTVAGGLVAAGLLTSPVIPTPMSGPAAVASNGATADATPPAEPERSSPAVLAAVATAATAAEPMPSAVVVGLEPARPERVRSRRGARRRAGVAPGSTPSPFQLDEEIRVLKRAKLALDGGSTPRALGLLDEYEREFPRAVLGDVQRGFRVRALCAAGRVAEARRVASRHPASSVVARGSEEVCGDEQVQ